MSGPTEGELRDAGIGLRLSAMTGVSILQLQGAVAAQSYTISARALGIGDEESQRVLREVIDELSTTGSHGDPFAIAQHRLAEGPDFRPPEELRDAARQMLAAGGYLLHPEHVDAQAWQFQRVVDAYVPPAPWYRRWWRRVRSALRGGSDG